jgi:hypothetical protein
VTRAHAPRQVQLRESASALPEGLDEVLDKLFGTTAVDKIFGATNARTHGDPLKKFSKIDARLAAAGGGDWAVRTGVRQQDIIVPVWPYVTYHAVSMVLYNVTYST